MRPDADGLDLFDPLVARWFRQTLGVPTPPQRLGWPSIAAGRSTLICAPTGSGKTLAAFLAGLDLLWREVERSPGVRILYVSPLKALNQDVSRNLLAPLEGIVALAASEGRTLRPLTVGVRSGDTPSADRRRMISRPPDILITTPESLHLMLTSRARDTLRAVSHVIVDEIHAVCGDKRGVFLSILLERLEALSPRGFVRIGLSATQRPLAEVARYLGGSRVVATANGETRREARPVEVVDAGQRKRLDLQVLSPTGGAPLPRGGSVWPRLEERLLDLIESHRSTIVFANNRRIAERLAHRLNELRADRWAARGHEPNPEDALTIRAHHGSLSLEERRETEDALKRGALTAVVATASLELGIDMGAVDLVCQIESPGSVARGMQRVGRAGHVVGEVSKGRLFGKTPSDLLESVALCRGMKQGAVECLRVPSNCLDVLAQQIVACVAVDRWEAPALFELIRGAHPYRDLPVDAFESVLSMISGRFPVGPFRDLRARVSWDRLHHRLAPLPGTARLAVAGGGTIPDTGQYPVHLGEGGPRLGELDEEFVLERRAGETFVLGTATWRIEAIEPHKVTVARAEGRSALTPFWRGERAGRSAELGESLGALRREVAERVQDDRLIARMVRSDHLESGAARAIRDHVARQLRVAGAVPDDRTVLVESFRDSAGEVGLAILTPYGAKLHHALKLALIGLARDRLGLVPACLHTDDGLLIRLPRGEAPPLDLLDGLTAEVADGLIRRELGASALFGLRFRQNAGRALLLPKPDPSRRTPLWLQRLRARDLLQVVRAIPDFPIVVETYRECLDDDLELPRLRTFLDRIDRGEIRVVKREGETASPFTSELLFWFERRFLYEWDEPQSGTDSPRGPMGDSGLLDQVLVAGDGPGALDPEAIGRVENRLRGRGRPPRSAEEAAECLRTLGDLAVSEVAGVCSAFLESLEREGRATRIQLPGTREPERWSLTEDRSSYLQAFPESGEGDWDAQGRILRRHLAGHALVGVDELVARYPIDAATATDWLERWEVEGEVVRVDAREPGEVPRWGEGGTLQEVRRLSVALRRRESVAVRPEVFVEFLLEWQGVGQASEEDGPSAVASVLDRLQGVVAPAEVWESDVFPSRVRGYRGVWLDEAIASGPWLWRVEPGLANGPLVGFVPRHGLIPFSTSEGSRPLSEPALAVLDVLNRQGASFAVDLARALGRSPSQVRDAIEELWRDGRVTNDRFDPLRPGASNVRDALESASRMGGLGPSVVRARRAPRRAASLRPEGRWSTLHPPLETTDAPEVIDAWASVLLQRFGVLTREIAALDRWAPSWRLLADRLARAELRGEIRRGYFVEGLSGIQYATETSAATLSRLAAGDFRGGPTLIHSLDPANLYGSGAPFDVDLLKEGTERFHRGTGHWLVVESGRPILIIESGGRRLTSPGSPSTDVLRGALGLLPGLLRGPRKLLKVETFNGLPTLSSPAAPLLAELGFVRDFPAMTLYGTW
ncbi:MAG: DEAD/DEAH box helicase [Isosphaeraceae bacterium]